MYTRLLQEEAGKPPSWAEKGACKGLGLRVYVAFGNKEGFHVVSKESRGRKRQREGLEAVSQGSCVPVKEFVLILLGVWKTFQAGL